MLRIPIFALSIGFACAMFMQSCEITQSTTTSTTTTTIPPMSSVTDGIYHVSPNGNNSTGNGEFYYPWQTLAYAVSQVSAGSTVYLDEGVHQVNSQVSIPLGVNIAGAGPTLAIINTTYNVSQSPLLLLYSTNVVSGNQSISGFAIDGNNRTLSVGLKVQNRKDVTIHDIAFREILDMGAIVYSSQVALSNYLTGIEIYNLDFTNCARDYSNPVYSSGNLNIGALDGADIHHITINDQYGYGIKFYSGGWFKNTKIHDSTITVNEVDVEWDEDCAIELWELGPGNQIYNVTINTWMSLVSHPQNFNNPTGTINMKVYNNRVIHSSTVNSPIQAFEVAAPGQEFYNNYIENKGYGFSIWDAGFKNIDIHNNVVYNSTRQNTWFGNSPVIIANSTNKDFVNIRIFNNVFVNAENGIYIENNDHKVSGVRIQNNLFVDLEAALLMIAPQQKAGGGDPSLVENTLINNNITTGSSAYLLEDLGGSTNTTSTGNFENILVTLGLRETGNRWDTWYQPSAATSYPVNKGLAISGFAFKGAAPDIGAFEWNE